MVVEVDDPTVTRTVANFPPWSTVHHYFRLWRLDGTWEKINATLRERIRVRAGRNPQPSAGINLWVYQGYMGAGKAWIEEQLGWSVEVVKHPPKARGEWQPRGDLDDLSTVWFEWVRLPAEPKKFRAPLPRRWVAERTIGWLSQSRRM